MALDPDTPLTELLNRFSEGDSTAEAELVPYLYRELRKMAGAQFRRERPGHTLQPTALVHEVYLRVVGRKTKWQGRAHFFAVAAQVMRSVLVDYARQRASVKRWGTQVAVSLEEAITISEDKCELVIQVDEALEKLRLIDGRQAKIVEMRYFAGMTEEEIGILLGISARTVKREWTMAKAWLAGALRGPGGEA
ncbi:MAG: sigma-70 family RNA polymerase sigma factor [Acidobacteriia bacterium]|nr:sigma-70 family RNA polymerase sigma factor [Terriglobia bacterium]